MVLLATATLLVLVEHNWSALNGPWYWKWVWRRLDPIRVVGWFLVPSVVFFAAQWVFIRFRKPLPAMALLMLAFFGFQLVAIGVQRFPFHLKQIAGVIENQFSTSFYTDALKLAEEKPPLDDWLRDFHLNLSKFHLHSMSRGPGPILFHWSFIRVFGAENHRAAMLAGLAIGLLATLSLPATYVISRYFWHDSSAAFSAASCLALCPGMIWFFPVFDSVYPAVGLAMIGLWVMAMDRNSFACSTVFGVLMAAVLFFVYNLLSLGVFLLGYTLLHIASNRQWKKTLIHIAVAAGMIVALYGVLWLGTGYQPIATFLAAVDNQDILKAEYHQPRPYFQAIPLDLMDFLLGAGWIALVLLVFFLFGDFRNPRWTPHQRRVIVLGFLQIGVVAATGLLAPETARIWAFMLPFLLIPVGLELNQWPTRARMLVYLAWLGLMMSIGGNMWFQMG